MPEEERKPNGCIQEAKGEGYADKLGQPWFANGEKELAASLENLSSAAHANNTGADMVMAEEGTAEFLREIQEADPDRLGNVHIRVSPPK